MHSVETKEEILARAKELNIHIKASIQELVIDSDLIFSTVTADQALKVARESCQFIKDGAFFLISIHVRLLRKKVHVKVLRQMEEGT